MIKILINSIFVWKLTTLDLTYKWLIMTQSMTDVRALGSPRSVKSGKRRWSLYPMCIPQSNITLHPPMLTIIQLLPTSKLFAFIMHTQDANKTYLDRRRGREIESCDYLIFLFSCIYPIWIVYEGCEIIFHEYIRNLETKILHNLNQDSLKVK